MTSYVKSTNFASKDSLASGNPLKIIKGTEFDIEFNNIATAIDSKADTTSPAFSGIPTAPTAALGTNTTQLATTAFVTTATTTAASTKADIISPAFAGVPTAPTAAIGTNTTQLATTAFVTAALRAVYPVGSIYINAGATTNPATLLGFGTWVAFGAGRVMVGLNGSDPLFDALEETGGSKDAIVVSHSHTGSTASAGSHNHIGGTPTQSGQTIYGQSGASAVSRTGHASGEVGYGMYTSTEGAHSHSVTVDAAGSSGTNANLQPYVTVAMWKRTA